MEIARGVGTLIRFGYYARILIDVDLTSDLPSSIIVTRERYEFPVNVIYENLCSHCSLVGHSVNYCPKINRPKKPKASAPTHKTSRRNQRKIVRKEYRVVQKNDVSVNIQRSVSSTPNVVGPSSRALDLGNQFAILEHTMVIEPVEVVENTEACVVDPMVEEHIDKDVDVTSHSSSHIEGTSQSENTATESTQELIDNVAKSSSDPSENLSGGLNVINVGSSRRL
ncbi:hypothetical protein M0R45_034345 [Rubus argutus]|uniref:Zinc knuckle CX2CX4HX4C domain-containing protein n=1 Tax=Rubus argutus TaxID=59490 RepID=A0AAW1VR34_RUBAR